MYILSGVNGETLKTSASTFIESNGDYSAMFFEGVAQPIFIPTDHPDARVERIEAHSASYGAVIKALGERVQDVDVKGDHLYRHSAHGAASFEWAGFWALVMATDKEHVAVLMLGGDSEVQVEVVPPVDNVDEHASAVLKLLGI